MWVRIKIYHKHKLKWGVEFVLDEPILGIQTLSYATIASSHFSSMVDNIGPSLVAMEPQRKLDLWTFDFERQALQWTSFVEQMMTSITWQFSH
jgi:hypothetical protein